MKDIIDANLPDAAGSFETACTLATCDHLRRLYFDHHTEPLMYYCMNLGATLGIHMDNYQKFSAYNIGDTDYSSTHYFTPLCIYTQQGMRLNVVNERSCHFPCYVIQIVYFQIQKLLSWL